MGLTSFRRACPTSGKIALIPPRVQSAQQSPVGSHRRGFFWCIGCAGLHGITGITLHELVWRSLCRPRIPKWRRIRDARHDSRSKRKAGACHVLRPLPSEGRTSRGGGMRPPGSPVGGNISASRDGGGAGGARSDRRGGGGGGRSGC